MTHLDCNCERKALMTSMALQYSSRLLRLCCVDPTPPSIGRLSTNSAYERCQRARNERACSILSGAIMPSPLISFGQTRPWPGASAGPAVFEAAVFRMEFLCCIREYATANAASLITALSYLNAGA